MALALEINFLELIKARKHILNKTSKFLYFFVEMMGNVFFMSVKKY